MRGEIQKKNMRKKTPFEDTLRVGAMSTIMKIAYEPIFCILGSCLKNGVRAEEVDHKVDHLEEERLWHGGYSKKEKEVVF